MTWSFDFSANIRIKIKNGKNSSIEQKIIFTVFQNMELNVNFFNVFKIKMWHILEST